MRRRLKNYRYRASLTIEKFSSHFKTKDIPLDVKAKARTCFRNYPKPAFDTIFQLDLVIIHPDVYNFIFSVHIKFYNSLKALTFFQCMLTFYVQ